MQTIEQTINVTVTDAAQQAGIVDGAVSGTGVSTLADTGTPTLIYLGIALALIIVAIAVVAFVVRKRYGTVRRSSFYSLVIALALGTGIATLAFSQPAANAAASLTLAGDSTVSITVPQGSTVTATANLSASTDSTAGYTLTAALDSTEPGIAVSLSGGDVTTSTSVPATSTTPLTVKSTTTANASGTQDIIPVAVTVAADSTVTPGTKQATITYAIDDNTIPAPTTMQAMTASYCTSQMTLYDGTNPEAILSLQDTRGVTPADYQTYEVAKLADGNCWMLNNLKLGSVTAPLTLTSSDSNVASDFTVPQLNDGTRTRDLSANPGNDYDTPYAYGPIPGDTGTGATNYGYLYNWSAATAGETRTTMPAGGGDAQYSICPANWRLPKGGADTNTWQLLPTNEFSILNARMAGVDPADPTYLNDPYQYYQGWQNNGPFKGVFSGYWDGSFYSQGGGGNAWSASADPDRADYAWGAYFNSGFVNPGVDDKDRSHGRGVRCTLGW